MKSVCTAQERDDDSAGIFVPATLFTGGEFSCTWSTWLVVEDAEHLQLVVLREHARDRQRAEVGTRRSAPRRCVGLPPP